MLALVGGYSILGLVIIIIAVAAAVAIMFVALRAFGIPLPSWLIQIVVIVLVAIVAIIAIIIIAQFAATV